MIAAYNFDHEKYIDQRNDISPLFDAADANHDIQRSICGGHSNFERDWMMPNSLVTFKPTMGIRGNKYLAMDNHWCHSTPSGPTVRFF